MVGPLLDQVPIYLLQALPLGMRDAYSNPTRLYCKEDEIPPDIEELNRRYSRFHGPESEWGAYLNRPEVEPLWELHPEEDAIALLAVA